MLLKPFLIMVLALGVFTGLSGAASEKKGKSTKKKKTSKSKISSGLGKAGEAAMASPGLQETFARAQKLGDGMDQDKIVEALAALENAGNWGVGPLGSIMFDLLDKDKNGVMDKEELAQWTDVAGPEGDAIKFADLDGDGKISKAEATKMFEAAGAIDPSRIDQWHAAEKNKKKKKKQSLSLSPDEL